MKAGIVTIYTTDNYGNRLQNYAVHKLLKDRGVEPETLRIHLHGFAPFIEFGMNCRSRLIRRRQKKFKEFIKRYTPTKLIGKLFKKQLTQLNAEYDVFFAGSDQIWNPYLHTDKYIMLLRFADKEKSMSISGSFGVSKLPEKTKKFYRDGFKNFKYISVRENEGKEIVDELLGQNVATVIPDPTLLLSKEDWLDIAKDEPSEKERYLLTYFLGNTKNAFEHIAEIAKENNLKIIHLNQRRQPEYFSAGVEQFVKLISEATLVATDSFHACAFSLKLETPFILFNRQGSCEMSSRTKSLFKMANMKDRTFDKLAKEDYFKLEYDKTELEKNVLKGHKFVDLCLGVKND